jgi:hypothetical protein
VTHPPKGDLLQMTVFFLSNSKNEAKKLLLRVLDMIVPKNKITLINDANELEHHLRQQVYENLIAVLFPSDKSELMNIISLNNLLTDIPIILVLPDRETNTIAMGHKLRARFITYADSDFLDVTAVMMKMKNKMETEESYQ